MFALRASDDWNLSHKLVKTEISPLSDEASQILASIVARQERLLATEQARLGAKTSSLLLLVLVASAIGIAFGCIVSWTIIRSITKSIAALVGFAEKIAEGDLAATCDLTLSGELGGLLDSMTIMRDRLARIVGEASRQSETVSGAAAQMSSVLQNVSTSAENLTRNMAGATTTVEELTRTISDIAANAEQSAVIAGKARDLAQSSNSRIDELGTAANEIGEVVEVIETIASQTNLLALNATIESARAGDAGKGFAVVASEVKELSRQTTTATENISQRIDAIQQSTQDTVQAIKEIDEVVQRVFILATNIASAVEEQSVTSKHIAQNVSQTATALEEVAKDVSQSSQEITDSISQVDQVLRQTTIVDRESETATAV